MDQNVSQNELPDDAARNATLGGATDGIIGSDVQLASIVWLAGHPAWRDTQLGRSFVRELRTGAAKFFGEPEAAALNDAIAGVLAQEVAPVQTTAGILVLLRRAATDAGVRLRLMYLSRAFCPEVLSESGFDESGQITAGAVLHLAQGGVSVSDVMTVLWPQLDASELRNFSQSRFFDDPLARLNKKYAEAAHKMLNEPSTPDLRRSYYDFVNLACEFGAPRTPQQDAALSEHIARIIREALACGLVNPEHIVTSLGIIVQRSFQVKEHDVELEDIPNWSSTNTLEWPHANTPPNGPQMLDASGQADASELPHVSPQDGLGDRAMDELTQLLDSLAPADGGVPRGADPMSRFLNNLKELEDHGARPGDAPKNRKRAMEQRDGDPETEQDYAPKRVKRSPGDDTRQIETFDARKRGVNRVILDEMAQSILWLATHPAWRDTATGRHYAATAMQEAKQRLDPAYASAFEELASRLRDEHRSIESTIGMLALLYRARRDDDLRLQLMSFSRTCSNSALLNRNVCDVAAQFVPEVLAGHNPGRRSQASVHDVARIVWPGITEAQLHALDQSISDRQRIEAPSGPSIQERPPSDVAYEDLYAHVGVREQTILCEWAMDASWAPGHTPVTIQELDAIQHTVDALRQLSPDIPVHDKFSALLRFSGLQREHIGQRDPRLIVVDMIVGSKIGAVAFLLHQIKPFFPTETAAVWRACKYFVDDSLDKRPAWQTAAELVGRATIQQYFAVRDQDAPQTPYLTPMADFVKYLFENPARIPEFAILAQEMQADEISAGQGQALLVRLNEFAHDVPAPDVFRAQMASAICRLATGCNTIAQWERKWRGPAREPQVVQPQVVQPEVVQPQVPPPLVAPPVRAKTSALSANARAMPLLSGLTPASDQELAGIRFHSDSDLREEHFSKHYEVISWCTKQPSTFQRLFGMPPQHYVVVKAYNEAAAPREAFPADMFISPTESTQPLTEHEVVGLLPCSKDRSHPRGAFIVRFPSVQAQAAMPPNGDAMNPAVKAANFVYAPHLAPEALADPAKDQECGLLTHAFSAARAAKRDDLRTANHLQEAAGDFKKFCDEIGTLASPPKFLPRMLRRRIVMHRTRERISALSRYEEHLQTAPFLESLPEYKGDVKLRWTAEKHPAEIKTGEIIGKKHGEVILRVGDTAYIAQATDILAQCRFTGVVPEDLTAGTLAVRAHGALRLNVQFKKNPEGKGFFIYTPRVDRFVTGHSTPGKRIRMALNDLPIFNRAPAVFYDWPKGKDAMLTGLAAPLRVIGKMRQNHKDYVVVYNSKSQHHEAFDGRYLLEELVRTGKLSAAEQRLVSGQGVYFTRDSRGRTCMVRTNEATLDAGRPLRDAALTRLTAALHNNAASLAIARDEPLPGQWNVDYQDRGQSRVVLRHDDGRTFSIPTEYFLKQHLERGGLLGPPMRPNTKITFSQTNGGLTVTAWQSPQLAAHGRDRAAQLVP